MIIHNLEAYWLEIRIEHHKNRSVNYERKLFTRLHTLQQYFKLFVTLGSRSVSVKESLAVGIGPWILDSSLS